MFILIFICDLIGSLPLKIVKSICTLSIYSQKKRHQRRSELNIKRCLPSLSASECSQLAEQHLYNLSFTLAEALVLLGKNKIKNHPKSYLVDTCNMELLQKALSKDKGIILACSHIGSWELIPAFLQTITDIPIYALYKPLKHKKANEYLHKRRNKHATMLADNKNNTAATLLKALKKQHIACIATDQVPPTNSGVYAPFFGHQTYTLTLIAKLAQKTQATVLGIAITRTKTNKFKLHFLPVDDAIYSADLTVSATALNAMVEQTIQIAPEQYMWCYKRFKHSADGIDFYT